MRTMRQIHRDMQSLNGFGATRDERDALDELEPTGIAELARRFPDLTPYQILALRRAKGDKQDDKRNEQQRTDDSSGSDKDAGGDGLDPERDEDADSQPGDSKQRPEPADDSAGEGSQGDAGHGNDEQVDGEDSGAGTGDDEGAEGNGRASSGNGKRRGMDDAAGGESAGGGESGRGDGAKQDKELATTKALRESEQLDGSGGQGWTDDEFGDSDEGGNEGDRRSGEDGAGDAGELDLSDLAYKPHEVRKEETGRRSAGAIGGDSGYVTFGKLTNREAIDKMRKALSRMSGGFGKFSSTPLWDYGKLLKRIVSKQDYMPAKKEDDGNPVILFLCDTSGSCHHISKQATEVAQSASILGVRGADVWVVYHDDLMATTKGAMHNGEPAQKKLEEAMKKLKNPARHTTKDILAVIRPQLVINITDFDSIKMNLDVLALGRWRTLVLDTKPDLLPAPGKYEDRPRAGLFYTPDALIDLDYYVGNSSYNDGYGKINFRSHLKGRYPQFFPERKTLDTALVMASRYLLFSFHNTSISAICASIDAYASPDRLARLTVR